MDFRPTFIFSGNNPNLVEIWGRENLENAETSPIFESSDNYVTSAPVSSESLTEAGWTLIHTQEMDGQNINNIEFEIDNLVKSRFIRVRYLDSVGGSACQFIEIGFSGFGIFPID